MHRYINRVFICFIISVVFTVSTNAYATEYTPLGNKMVVWKSFNILPADGWLIAHDSNQCTLIYNHNNKYGGLILDNTDIIVEKKDYQKIVRKTYAKISADKDTAYAYLNIKTPYSVFGMKNTPAVISITKGKKFFTFLPYVNKHMYIIVAISWSKYSDELPPFLVNMLNNIFLDETSSDDKTNSLQLVPIDSKIIWNKFAIFADNKWRKNTAQSSNDTLVLQRNIVNNVELVIINSDTYELNNENMSKFKIKMYKKIKNNPLNKEVTLYKVSRYAALGDEHCAMITYTNGPHRMYLLMPYYNGRVYTIIVDSIDSKNQYFSKDVEALLKHIYYTKD